MDHAMRILIFTLFSVFTCLALCGQNGTWAISQIVFSMWPEDWFGEAPMQQLEDEAWRRLWSKRHSFKPVLPIREVSMESCNLAPLNLSEPILLRGYLNATNSSVLREWNLDWLSDGERGNVAVTYFSDARVSAREGGATPDGIAPLNEVVRQLREGRPVKTGSENLFRAFPYLVEDLPLEHLGGLFGGIHQFQSSAIGKTLTVPIFLSSNSPQKSPSSISRKEPGTRTDFHCEPIANLAIQLQGRKKWTLANPSESMALRPKVSRDGRAYIYSDIDPEDNEALGRAERLTAVAEAGDLLYVPAWWWHRVDYENCTSFTVSLFHLRFGQLLRNNPLFAFVLLPNLIKELLSWKTQ